MHRELEIGSVNTPLSWPAVHSQRSVSHCHKPIKATVWTQEAYGSHFARNSFKYQARRFWHENIGLLGPHQYSEIVRWVQDAASCEDGPWIDWAEGFFDAWRRLTEGHAIVIKWQLIIRWNQRICLSCISDRIEEERAAKHLRSMGYTEWVQWFSACYVECMITHGKKGGLWESGQCLLVLCEWTREKQSLESKENLSFVR